MNDRTGKVWILIFACSSFLGCTGTLNTIDTAGKPAIAIDFTDREEFIKAQSPSLNHRNLDLLKGSWSLEGSGYLPSANGPTPTFGMAKSNWVVDGNFLKWTASSNPISDSTRVSETIFYLGYDNLREMYAMWIMSTGSVMIQYLTGTYNDLHKSFTFVRTSVLLFEGEKTSFDVRFVIDVSKRNELIWEYFEEWNTSKINNGEEFKLWSNKYKNIDSI